AAATAALRDFATCFRAETDVSIFAATDLPISLETVALAATDAVTITALTICVVNADAAETAIVIDFPVLLATVAAVSTADASVNETALPIAVAASMAASTRFPTEKLPRSAEVLTPDATDLLTDLAIDAAIDTFAVTET